MPCAQDRDRLASPGHRVGDRVADHGDELRSRLLCRRSGGGGEDERGRCDCDDDPHRAMVAQAQRRSLFASMSIDRRRPDWACVGRLASRAVLQ